MEVVASLSQGRTAAAQCGLFTYKSVPVIFEPPCNIHVLALSVGFRSPLIMKSFVLNILRSGFCAITCFVTVMFNIHTAYRLAIMSIMAVRKKGKVFLFLGVKACRRSRGLAPLFRNLGNRWRLGATSRSGRFTTGKEIIK